MLYEIRNSLKDNYTSDFEFLQDNDYVYAIGSEQCCVSFLRETNLCEIPRRFTLVTPKTDVFHFKAVMDRICKLCKDNEIDSIVVNDLGIMHCLRDLGNTIELTVGRVLLGSFGYKESLESFIHPDEKTDVVNNAIAPCVIHKSKIDLFDKYNITSAEVCICENEKNYMSLLKNYGIKIHLHLGTILSALSKTCFKLSSNDNGTLSCNYECDKLELLKLAYINNYNPLDKNSIVEDDYNKLISSFQNYYLSGNAIYRISENHQYNPLYYDRIIIDKRFCFIKNLGLS